MLLTTNFSTGSSSLVGIYPTLDQTRVVFVASLAVIKVTTDCHKTYLMHLKKHRV